jgi:predicted kinase
MASIEILRGYSASGKSTYARQSGKFIVSRDLIRQQLTGRSEKTVLSPGDENTVTALQEAQVRDAVEAGLDVVIDDTNLVLKFARRWAELAEELGVEWSVTDFKPDEAQVVFWNVKREDDVPLEVIKSQMKRFPYKQWQPVVPKADIKPVFKPYVPDTTKPRAVGFDLDGTLAHMNGRSPYDESRYHEDTYDDNLRRLTWSLSQFWKDHGNHYQIIVFSGRSEEYREVCEKWLRKNAIHFDLLVMRKEGDKRRDDIVKSELFDEFIAPNYNLLYHFDDRQRVVDALRSKGITVYQVASGLF